MLENDKKQEKDKSPKPEPVGKGTVLKYFTKFKVRAYQIESFCLYFTLKPESELTESDFSKKLKEFQTRKIG